MSFSSIQDQRVPLRLLRNMLARNRIPNALLFWGPSGVGKGMTALQFAKAVCCESGNDDACDSCLPCRKIDHGNHPDLHTVAPLKKSRIIDVEAIDGIIEMASLRPFESEWRVFIIQEADRIGVPAQNHLLKTLEEPVGKSVFILISENPQFLLPTIRSRCQRMRFGSLAPETVKSILLRERDISEEEASAVAAVAQGQASRALDLVDSDKRAVVFDVVARLSNDEDPLAVAEDFGQYLAGQKAQIEASLKAAIDPDQRQELGTEDRDRIKEEQLALVDAMSRRDTMEYLYLLESWYRDSLVYAATGDLSRVLNQDQRDLFERAGEADYARLTGYAGKLAAIEKARVYLERFLNEERVFRDLFFALAP